MPLPRRDIHRALTQKGFQQKAGSSHDLYFLVVGGKFQAIRTQISRGSGYKDLDDSGVSRIARQLFLQTSKFKDLVSCTMRGEDYVNHLVKEKRISEDQKQI